MAALVMLLAGLAKLRSPSAAADALALLGLVRLGAVGRGRGVRVLALVELALAASALSGAEAPRMALGALYLGFAAAVAVLVRRAGQCGCFGETSAPASPIHVALNLGFGALCLLAATGGARGLAGLAGLPIWQSPAALLGIAAATAAAVLAYTELPRAWQAWHGGLG